MLFRSWRRPEMLQLGSTLLRKHWQGASLCTCVRPCPVFTKMRSAAIPPMRRPIQEGWTGSDLANDILPHWKLPPG